MEQMPLVKSVIYESLWIEPLVSLQYRRAKHDLIIEINDATFLIDEGEMIYGYQPFVTKDLKIFNRPKEFVLDKFFGECERLLKHLLWSNGLKIEMPTVGNKQCAGKDFVVLVFQFSASRHWVVWQIRFIWDLSSGKRSRRYDWERLKAGWVAGRRRGKAQATKRERRTMREKGWESRDPGMEK